LKINSIQLKIISLIFFILLVAITLVVYISIYNQRNAHLNEAKIFLSIISDLMQNTIKNLMLKGEAPIALTSISDFKTIQELEEINLYRRNGEAAFIDYSTIDFVNSYQDEYLFEKTNRIQTSMTENKNFKSVVETEKVLINELKDTNEIEYFLPLRNVYECWECHGKAAETSSLRGIAYIKISLSDTFKRINKAISTLIFILVFSGMITVVLIVIFLRKIVITPLLTIGNTVKAFGEGKLDENVKIKNKDELGDLANKLNDMFVHVRERIHLSKFVSKSTDNMIKKGKTFDASLVEKKNISVLFSDIRGFTSYSESNSPDTVIKNLNRILQIQADIVAKHNGDIDKFVGDELMAIFDEEYNAVIAGYEMITSIIKLNRENNLNLYVGIGINTGEVIAGNIGSSHRLEYAVIGDTVNLASRLCGIAKPSMLLISETTYEKVKDNVRAKFIADQKIKGKSANINFYAVLGLKVIK